MKCEELLGGLNHYVDGETRSGLCKAIQEHLADCKGCQIVIDNIRQTITLCRVGESEPLPAGLHETICLIMKRRWAAMDRLPCQPR